MTTGIAARATLALAGWRYLRPFLAQASDPRRAQELALRRILDANAATEFGRAHGFQNITTRAAFRAAVPVQTHDTLSDAVQRQARTGAQALTAAPPVFYARTSGTTAPARDFPVTAQAQAAQRAAQRVLAAVLHRGSGFFDGQVAALGGPHIEGRLPSGQPYGSASGQTYATTPRALRNRFVIPEPVFANLDAGAKYHAYALHMLAAADLTGVITANPSTLLSVIAHVAENTEAVLRDLSDGTQGIAAQPDRARVVQAALGQGAPMAQIWPRLNALATWNGGNCQVALDRLRPMLPPDMTVAEIGYRASEFIGTINVDVTRNLCLPDLGQTVFEFVEEENWEADTPDFLWLDQIEAGRSYYVFATTRSGLYRYHINDVVRVSGRVQACPALEFFRKGQGVTSITGEKLHEGQAIAAARQAMQAIGLPAAFFVALADAEGAIYRLFHEAAVAPDGESAARAATEFDAALCDGNIEYAAKRTSRRLNPAEVVFLRPGCGEAVKAAGVAAGQREAQFKAPALADAARWRVDLAPFRWDARNYIP